MTISPAGIQLIKNFESLALKAYFDPGTGNLPVTIGYGSTRYIDGRLIKMGDTITQEQADAMLKNDLREFSANVTARVTTSLNQNQADALISFAYNVGTGSNGFGGSTLLRKVNANPNDPTIAAEFLRWNRSGGRVMRGLTRRRQAESDLYFAVA